MTQRYVCTAFMETFKRSDCSFDWNRTSQVLFNFYTGEWRAYKTDYNQHKFA